MRVCQFRHDGKWTSIVAAAPRPPDQEDLHVYFTARLLAVKLSPPCHVWSRSHPTSGRDVRSLPAASLLFRMTSDREQPQSSSIYSSFAFIVIFAFSTLETGQPFSAASAYF